MTEQQKQNQQIQLLKQVHRWRLACFGIVILIAGIVIGSAGMAVFQTAKRHGQKPTGYEDINMRAIVHLQEKLDLNEEQREQFKAIYTEHMKALHEIRKKARGPIAEQMNSLNEQVLEILDEDQKQEWTKSIIHLRDKFDPRKGRRSSGRRGGRSEYDGRRRPSGRGTGYKEGQTDPFDFWRHQQERPEGPRQHRRPERRPGDRMGPGGPDMLPPEHDMLPPEHEPSVEEHVPEDEELPM